MDICVDFDGTCTTHGYPNVGEDIGAVAVLKELVEQGHNLILFTMRSGKELNDAVQWFKNNDIKLHGVNTNPTQRNWTESPKAYGQLYIDDAALGIPLVRPWHARPYVDWFATRRILEDQGVLPRVVEDDKRLYMYRVQIVHPDAVDYGTWYDWEIVSKTKYDEINDYIARGYAYQTCIMYPPAEQDFRKRDTNTPTTEYNM